MFRSRLLAGAIQCGGGSAGPIRVLSTPQGQAGSEAWEINDEGVVAGVAGTQSGGTSIYYWDAGGTPHNAGFPPGSAPNAMGLNNSGTIVSGYFGSTNGTLTTLPELIPNGGYNNYLYDINDAGTVAGKSVCSPSNPDGTHATIWDRTGIHDLTTSPGALSNTAASEALLINDSDQVVGIYGGDVNPEVFFWQSGSMTHIGNFLPWAMNNLGEVVGISYNEADYYSGAYATAYL